MSTWTPCEGGADMTSLDQLKQRRPARREKVDAHKKTRR